jgi:hypothetical protein
MKIKYFEDTDTALLEPGTGCVTETREPSEEHLLGHGCARAHRVHHGGTRQPGDLFEFSSKRVSKETNQTLEPTR